MEKVNHVVQLDNEEPVESTIKSPTHSVNVDHEDLKIFGERPLVDRVLAPAVHDHSAEV